MSRHRMSSQFLPTDCLLVILQHLPFSTRLQLELLSKSWKHSLRREGIWETVDISQNRRHQVR